MDLHHRAPKGTGLQPAAFDYSANSPKMNGASGDRTHVLRLLFGFNRNRRHVIAPNEHGTHERTRTSKNNVLSVARMPIPPREHNWVV